MTTESHDWIVLHHVRFATAIDGTGRPFPGPPKAEMWRFYPAAPATQTMPNGMRGAVADNWGGFSVYPTRAAAEEVFAAPEAHLPLLRDSVEEFHALAVPFAHRGKVNWRGSVRENDTFAIAPADPGGTLAVITSAGYDNPGPEDVPRIANFIKEVDAVVAYYATLPGNIRARSHGGGNVDGGDGLTLSLWRDDQAMMAAAYKPGYHRQQIDYHKEVGHFDRSSFTRLRIVASRGTWDGGDPLSEIL